MRGNEFVVCTFVRRDGGGADLQHERDEGLHLQDLGSLFHQNIVILYERNATSLNLYSKTIPDQSTHIHTHNNTYGQQSVGGLF